MTARLVLATPEHAKFIAANARHADTRELWAQARMTPFAAMLAGMERGVFTLTGMIDDEPACMLGVTPISALGGHGAPWLVTTPAIEKAQITFLRHCRPVVREMHGVFPVLFNLVDARNALAIRWLSWLGFRIKDPVPYGPDALPFHPFWMTQDV